jgi:trehalose synthase-fused probable maltokinase
MLERLKAHGGDESEADAAAAVFARLGNATHAGKSIRGHGDFHLGQVLFTDRGWYVLDFEGEPGRPPAERRAHTSPLRDVAGMLRSLDYAAQVAVNEHAPPGELAPLGRVWERHNRAAFLEAYEPVVVEHGLVPADPADRAAVLHAFELDKALYEVRYEQAHRPDWVSIPMLGVARLLAHEQGAPR